ncbi:hypothetical protein QBC47DRAFT_120624 [Echria macrotheca]|uniref:Uncharacterized protein n=1 Tax=Echria macrotheca TaxID=438768 RepID=A0AAJ0B555_9PEZI|nr:hypothetical protein QBC47DRAFT_120624 [Echria macrotheca]
MRFATAAPVSSTDQVLAYLPDPTGRGTFGLIYTCLLTLVLCLWTAMHPDVGYYKDRRFYGAAYKAGWMVSAILLPEFVVCCAVAQFRQAYHLREDWRRYWLSDPKRRRWLGWPGAFLVAMGGYEITGWDTRVVPAAIHPSSRSYSDSGIFPVLSPLTSSDAMATNMPILTDKPLPDKMDEKGEPPLEVRSMDDGDRGEPEFVFTLTVAGLRELLKPGDETLRDWVAAGHLNETHFAGPIIEDKSKADFVAKLLTTVQILWVVVQWIGRKAEGLPVTLLEVQILIQIPYTLLAYFFWWHKPLDVRVPITLPIGHLLPDKPKWKRSTYDNLDSDCDPQKHKQFMRKREICSSVYAVGFRASYDMAWNFDFHSEVWSTVMAVINGGLHATAWFSHFPTNAERNLWRSACIAVGVSPIIINVIAWKREIECYPLLLARRQSTHNVSSIREFIFVGMEMWTTIVDNSYYAQSEGYDEMTNRNPKGLSRVPRWCRHALVGIFVFSVLMYSTCIWFFLVEAFISTRSLQISAYKTVNWTNFLPHF